MAIKNNFPATRPSLNLDFANTKQLDPRITFTRATSGTYYDGKTVAKAEENLLTFSEDFDAAVWGKTDGTVTANTDTAPDGTTTADTFAATSANATLMQAITASALIHTFTVFLKRKTGAGTIEIQSVAGAWTSVTLTASWQRFEVSATPTAGSRASGVRIVTSGDEVFVWGAQLEQR